MTENNTSWPSYYIKEHINNNVGMLKGVLEIALNEPGQVDIKIQDDLTYQAVYNLYGNLVRGVRVSYEVVDCTEK